MNIPWSHKTFSHWGLQSLGFIWAFPKLFLYNLIFLWGRPVGMASMYGISVSLCSFWAFSKAPLVEGFLLIGKARMDFCISDVASLRSLTYLLSCVPLSPFVLQFNQRYWCQEWAGVTSSIMFKQLSHLSIESIWMEESLLWVAFVCHSIMFDRFCGQPTR